MLNASASGRAMKVPFNNDLPNQTNEFMGDSRNTTNPKLNN